MKATTLGNSSLAIPPIGVGCNRLLDAGDAGLLETVDEAMKRGIVHFDSAESYGQGSSEEFLAAALKDRRADAFIATKFGLNWNDKGEVFFAGDPDYVRNACDASLKRLQTDYIDLYYQHRVDPNVPVEETWGVMKELVEAGKVKALGISNPSVDELRRAHAVHPVSALQMEYSLFTRDVEAEYLPVCRELGITFVAYGPMGFALLGDEIKSKNDFAEGDTYRRNMPRFQDQNIGANLDLMATLREIADDLGATTGQVALAWLMAGETVVVPIPGSRKKAHLIQNAEACEIELSAEQYARLDAAYPPGAAHGANR